MEILSERLRDGRERNAFTIRGIHNTYMVKTDCEPVLRFQWNIESEYWEYRKLMHYAYNEEVLEANEILVRIPLSDSSPQVHKPYIDDMSDADTVYKMENAINMVMNLEEPACAMNLKKALVLINKKR